MQLNGNIPSLKATTLYYNPITNPIPVVNQNPYISKGKLDHVAHVRAKGKIIPNDYFSR